MTVMPARNFVSGKSPAQLRYAVYLRGYRWRWYVRPLSIFLDGGMCRYCGTRKDLQVHHLPEGYKYRGKGPNDGIVYQLFGDALDIIFEPWRIFMEIWYTTTLCDIHHKDAHGIK